MTEAGPPRELVATQCFGCGDDNPHGLHLQFERVGPAEVRSQVTLPGDLCGWQGVAHGGIVSLLLDEVTSWGVGLCLGDKWFVTRELKVRYLRPTPVEQPLTLTGRVLHDNEVTMDMVGEVRLADGRLTARGWAQFVRLDEERYDRFQRNLPNGS